MMMAHKSASILILGGTIEARTLATTLQEKGYSVTLSLAGRTKSPLQSGCTVRVGGFGGVNGLIAYLRIKRPALVIDATHPFATTISGNLAIAAKKANIPIIRVERSAWRAEQGDDWQHSVTLDGVFEFLPPASSVLVTIGRQYLDQFLTRDDLKVTARVIEAPPFVVPSTWKIITARPPFTLAEEIDLFKREHIEILVTKNSGGFASFAKLLAARQLKKSVILIDRPIKPPVLTLTTIEAANNYVDGARLLSLNR